MEAQLTGSPASSPSFSKGRSTQIVPLMGVETGDCGARQPTTMIRRKSGVSVRVSASVSKIQDFKQAHMSYIRILFGIILE